VNGADGLININDFLLLLFSRDHFIKRVEKERCEAIFMFIAAQESAFGTVPVVSRYCLVQTNKKMPRRMRGSEGRTTMNSVPIEMAVCDVPHVSDNSRYVILIGYRWGEHPKR
jgi:hypothetical protein